MSTVLGVLVAATVLVAPGLSAPTRSPGLASRRPGPGSVPVGRLAELLDRADVDVAPSRVPVLWGALVGVGAVMGLVLAGPGGAPSGAAGGVVVPIGWIVARGDRRRARRVAALPELLELVARGLRGGADLTVALGDAAEATPAVGPSLRRALHRASAGERLGDALDAWVDELDHPDAGIVRAVLRLGSATGAALAAALERAATTLRERAALRAELSALTAQTRTSSVVVAVAPLAFLLILAATDARVSEVLFATGWGRLCLVSGLALDAAGVVWMRRLTARVAP